MYKYFRKKYYLYILITSFSIIGLYLYAPYFVVQINNPVVQTGKNLISKTKHNFISKQGTDFFFKTKDNLQLSVSIYFSKNKPAKANIILLHGIGSSKESFYPIIELLNKNNYNAIALDLRAHGNSEGDYCTFGFNEKEDVRDLINYLEKQKKSNIPYGIWGHSLGGAISFQALAIDKRIKFGIIESTYSEFDKITEDYGKYYMGFDAGFIRKDIVERGCKLAGFNMDKVNPVEYCPKITQPVLIIHGADDKKIDIKYAYENYKALGSLQKKFIRVEKAGHNNLWSVGNKKLFGQIFNFIDMSLNKKKQG